MSNGFSRRDVMKTSMVLLGGSCLPAFRSKAKAEGAVEPHFFIFVSFFPGADPSYLFDARPLTFTAASKMANYTGKDPEVWTGSNGQKTLASAPTAALKEFKNDISIVNGVMMSTFDGHTENQNFILSGSPFGGVSFIPELNGRNAMPLDMLQLTSMFSGSITNGGASLQTNPSALASLSQLFQEKNPAMWRSSTESLIGSRLEANSTGSGSFSSGVKLMSRGFNDSGDLAAKLRATTIQQASFDPATGMLKQPPVPVNLQVVGQFFTRGITRSLFLGVDGNFDTHDPGSAAQSPQTFTSAVQQLVDLIKYLKATPYDQASGKSLFDVTTVMVGSEFGRTMRQTSAPKIDQTGTDHNPLSNSFMLMGKGIKGGQVIGASDMTELDTAGNLANVSGAHKQLDAEMIKLMGQPFDYQAGAPVAGAQPMTFDNTQYLSVGALANTVYRLFGYSEQDVAYRRFSAGGDVIPYLKNVLV